MDQSFINRMQENGYNKIAAYTGNTSVYVRYVQECYEIVLCFDVPENQLLTGAVVKQVRDHVLSQYLGVPCKGVSTMSLIWTNHVERERPIAKELQRVWLIDKQTQQLLIYENQPGNFGNLKALLENCLKKESVYAFHQAKQQSISKRGICNVAIIAVNILVFLVLSMLGSTTDTGFMFRHGAMYVPDMIINQHYYELFTAMFLHFGFLHIFNNMLVLFVLGDNLERAVGKVKFLIIYFGSGIVGNVVSGIMEYAQGEYAVSAGASGAIMGVIGALIYILIRNKGRLENLRSTQLYLMVGCTLYYGIMATDVNNAAHIGGLLSGFLLSVLLYHKKRHSIR